jgi:hypothetical protein
LQPGVAGERRQAGPVGLNEAQTGKALRVRLGAFGSWLGALGFGIWDLGFGMSALGFGIWDLGFGIWDLGFGA